MNMQDLNGQRVVVTGGSEGLGLAMVEALAASGDRRIGRVAAPTRSAAASFTRNRAGTNSRSIGTRM
jgi:NAD(P)-dependent dehydrogenase (short-subunit alcohol dehydrogenase family)